MGMKSGQVNFIGEVISIKDELTTIKINDEYYDGLHYLATFSHIIILYWFHKRDNQEHRSVLRVTPKRHKRAPEIGVLTSRSPSRINPIGLCVTELTSIDKCILKVKGLDALQGSPIVDVKPYLPRADSISDARVPEYMQHGLKT
ncbi:MAG TPA: tRNA (N6-threonylcarbamoyladenosine(37)-N6)-methyltransferase TrmO [Nitrososphaerales archaeon]|jgi:formylmethanofuran dehydrogenase subunit E|nr:tRNA (N6-threonylcarbamoyladenosine(37)-N6)-methyltransferase TrmO [Nitrososphaerales archaeon]|tara:strand:- start:381 stop:815 length:435 start_codon:yes stop_codon:yes gene_type:complete